jgi:hypothetical protein
MLHKISRSEIKTVYKNLKRFGMAVPEPVEGLHHSSAEIYLINNDIMMTKSLEEVK